ncbi:MAG: prepilin-type N-terminal cleavage/methylation domain-containing protein [Verrucomicrobiae bacterium]|nr:prepilin-type N-terminal cleavage/methylation domain-containing protein [Verrucomicrobiae bacterium]MDW8308530.1 prepilin-type N-terminal cleavage/methylation domain-containing protein [Verrucomicrobiales bacterium]
MKRIVPLSRARQPDGFTLIEVMVVVGIMGLIAAMGIPSMYRLLQKQGMRKATSDVVEVCSLARARAILTGQPADVTFYPLERRLTAGGGAEAVDGSAPEGPGASNPSSALPGGTGGSAQLPDDITIEMLDINLAEYRESEWARVRFFPNGTADEMTLILRSTKNEWKKITIEPTTGLASVDEVTR